MKVRTPFLIALALTALVALLFVSCVPDDVRYAPSRSQQATSGTQSSANRGDGFGRGGRRGSHENGSPLVGRGPKNPNGR